MKTPLALTLCLGAFAFAFAAEAEQIEPGDLNTLPPADVVLLGEVHDNPAHHENQRIALTALAPRAVVFEMLTEAQAQRVTPGLVDDPQALERALGWAQSGWPDFAMYYPLFKATSGARVFGAQLTRDSLRAAVMGDALAAFGDGAERFGLDHPLPGDQQSQREALQMAAHCDALPEDMLPGMVMAQRLRDAALARAVVQAFEATGGPVAVITGNGHAQTAWGVPVVLAQAAPDLTVLSIGQLEEAPQDEVAHDLWLVTAPAEREDPCKAFQ